MSIAVTLKNKGLITPPHYVTTQIQYETMMGSEAYGVSSDSSDIDIYGFCIPYKDIIFPHLKGEILGFGKSTEIFNQFQQHHIINPDNGKEYDLSIYNIVKYFQLCMENNPNIIDSLFTSVRCVLHSTKIANHVRENRKLFLHKGSWHKFRGYSFSQLHKAAIKNPEGKRRELVDGLGWDTKFGYHVIRLVLEVEQILTEGDLDLERHRELLKDVRRGNWSFERVKDWFSSKEKQLDEVYHKSELPYKPDEVKIKALLLECLEEHFGNLNSVIVIEDKAVKALREISEVIDNYNRCN